MPGYMSRAGLLCICRGVGYKSDFMTYCTNKLYGLMFARELATRLKVCSSVIATDAGYVSAAMIYVTRTHAHLHMLPLCATHKR